MGPNQPTATQSATPMQGAIQATQSAQPSIEDIEQAKLQAARKNLPSYDQKEQLSKAAISQAMAIISPNSKDPEAQIGQSIATPNYAGYCLQWVDDQQGNTNRYPTAIADYQAHAQAGDISTSDKIPAGARVYFSPNDSNGEMGHVGISDGNGQFTSATDNGVKTYSIKDWENATGQSYLGYSTTK